MYIIISFIIITSFAQIDLTNKSLIVVDIDETVLQYPSIGEKWWKNKKEFYKTKYDHETANNFAYEDWLKYIEITEPLHTDYIGLEHLFTKVYNTNSDIIFLTARHKNIDYITKNHMEQIGIKNIPIYYTGGKSKGTHLNKIYSEKYNYHNNIIFIDDMEHNINSVKQINYTTNTNSTVNVKCYKFELNT